MNQMPPILIDSREVKAMTELERMALEDLNEMSAEILPEPIRESMNEIVRSCWCDAWGCGWLAAANLYIEDPQGFISKVIHILDEAKDAKHATYHH